MVSDYNYLFNSSWMDSCNNLIETFFNKLSCENLKIISTYYVEKTINQKNTGSYYTPIDVVDFLILETKKESRIKNPTIIDPTSGSGAFLEGVLRNWNFFFASKEEVLNSIFANDLNDFALEVWKQKAWMWAIDKGLESSKVKKIIEKNTSNLSVFEINKSFDIIIGNPPYFETPKTQKNMFGNIYANIIKHCISIKKNSNSIISFVVPISIQTTNRMKPLRELMLENFNSYKFASFADRPSCIFVGVHQKISIFTIFNSKNKKRETTSYNQWRSNDRKLMFDNIKYFSNDNIEHMIGSKLEEMILKKVLTKQDEVFYGEKKFYVSQRITHWAKSFPYQQESKEYQEYSCETREQSIILSAIYSSNVYFLYWSLISDGWHNTKGMIKKFKIPKTVFSDVVLLNEANKLFTSLEKGKIEINTKQTKFAYKHRNSIQEIRKIDSLLQKHYDFSNKEINYIQNYLKEIR